MTGGLQQNVLPKGLTQPVKVSSCKEVARKNVEKSCTRQRQRTLRAFE